MNTEELEGRVRSLDDRLRTIEDTQEIEDLQLMYGYYLEYGMWDEVVDLFSDNTESMELGTSGVYLGKAGVERLCRLMKENRVPKEAIPREELREMITPRIAFMVLTIKQPVIDLDAGGTTACGRWGILEILVRPVGRTWTEYWGHGMYENEFVKEDGRWRFKKLRFYLTFHAPYEGGWLATPNPYYAVHPTVKPDRPTTGYHPYPEVCTVPFHYKHPLTGK